MATRVLLRDRPNRAIALTTSTHALILRHIPSALPVTQQTAIPGPQGQAPGTSGGPRCIVELSPLEKTDLSDYRSVSNHNIHGTLGLITVDNDVFLCLVSGASRAAVVRPGETVQRILNVDFYCLNKSDYDHILHDNINLYPTDTLDEEGYEHGQALGRRDPPLEHPCLALKKLLSGGSFYYSANFDLTSRLQDRSAGASTFDFDTFDHGYLWNSYMIQPLADFRSRLSDQERDVLDAARLLTFAIRGFILTISIPAHISPARRNRSILPSSLTLISRLSCLRAGTRFNARGIDDDGNVANFVESETVYWSPSGICFSYVQVRGSIPLFWEQAAGLLPNQQKIQITRSPQATQPAFDKHFEDLEVTYGPVHVVNLLSKEKSGEVELAQRYHNHIIHASLNGREGDNPSVEHRLLRETWYDFHAETKGPTGYEAASGIKQYIVDSAEAFAYCLTEIEDQKADMDEGDDVHLRNSVVILQQQGVFRVNCLDCLDRTNLMQTLISQMAIEGFLAPRGERPTGDFLARHGSLWADNGDALSKIYAGTGALKSSFTRSGKMTIAGALADARKSATRMYINNFADKGRQITMDMLLGRLLGQSAVYLYDPINDFVNSELNRRASEYSSTTDIRIWAGTLNLNGRIDGINSDLSPWLCPAVGPAQQNPDIAAVGFQEIVELSPQHIMSTEPTRRQEWERAVKRTLNANANSHGWDEYVQLRGGQLVGASLSIFVKRGIINRIKNVEGSLKKTGMSGMAGNKGAVAIRMEIDNTSICFVTAHLAAGFANYEERNRDFRTISHGLRFQRNRSIDDHDAVIWLGDFNYRIGLGDEKVRKLAKANDFEALYENDQLNLQMVAGLTFPYYSEARILFSPTYKYDLGSDEYDTSEKARIPAWCDRILRKGNGLRQVDYNTAPLRFSDHRPVYATFTCNINIVDEKVKDALSKQIYTKRQAVVGGSTANNKDGEEDDEDLIGYESIAPGLPPASSDRRKWWLDNGLPARSKIQAPGDGLIPNPNRPSNPFSPTTQPDWISDRSTDGPRTRDSSQAVSLRKLPPPFQPSSLPPTKDFDGASDTRSIRSPSGSSIASDVSSSPKIVNRKAAPPVPRKPALFSSHDNRQAKSPSVSRTSSVASSINSQNGHRPFATTSSQSPTSGNLSYVNATTNSYGATTSTRTTTFPPPPRRTTGGQAALPSPVSATSRSIKSQQRNALTDEEEKPPKLPPRRILMDDDDEDAGGDTLSNWAPLKPS